MKKNDHNCPEIENMKKVTKDFFKETDIFIEKYKEKRGEK